jgi:signal recognition particle subunit SRP54
VPVYSAPDDVVASGVGDPVAVAAGALAEARRTGRDVMIVDTAGRLAIDAELMEQVRRISDEVSPDYTFLVVDAMTGQDAVGVAESFHQTLELDGVILTKLDGDARGGAALSVKEVVGRPIAFASTGEKLDDFELFHPDRLAGRILGMGDMLTLIEKAEAVFETEEAEVAAERMMAGTFTLDDFLDQLAAIKKMGPLSKPGRDDARHAQGDPRRRAGGLAPGPRRGDHPLDEPSRSATNPTSSTGRAGPASPRGREPRPARSASCSASSARCAR